MRHPEPQFVIDEKRPHLGGVCECGCGKRTSMVKETYSSRGYVKGEPHKFLPGHYPRTRRSLEELEEILLRDRVITSSGCWEWTRVRLPTGYGKLGWGGHRQKESVHRLSAHLWLGFDLDSGLQVCHHCDNPPCFNPDHLFIGTMSDNLQDASRKGRLGGNPRKGESNGSAKISTETVLQIRSLAEAGWLRADIARSSGLSWSQTARIVSGESWSHV